MISNISILELKNKINQINIIDIRDIQKYNNNHIPTAKNIPGLKLITDPHRYINKNEKYYIYCQKGETSIKVANILTKQGYQIINIIGGYESWILES